MRRISQGIQPFSSSHDQILRYILVTPPYLIHTELIPLRITAKLHVLLSVLLPLTSLTLPAQKLKKVTVLPPRDLTQSGAKLNIALKMQDELMVKLTESHKFAVFNREELAAIAAERNLKFDADFDPRNAPKSGLQKVCDYIITGHIDAFDAVINDASKDRVVYKSNEKSATISIKIAVSMLDLETGRQVASASAKDEKTVALGKATSTGPISAYGKLGSLHIPGTTNKSAAANTDQPLQKVVDDEIESVAADLVGKLIADSANANAEAAANTPKVLGIVDGAVLINKGSNDSMENGSTFDVLHLTNTGIMDDSTHQPIMIRKKVCTVTITSVDDTVSQGKCNGPGTPVKGDELKAVAR